jgi:RNA polymerase sigma-70 factor (ECF subfamily)
LERLRRGDRSAIEPFYAAFSGPLWRFVYSRMAPDEARARDVFAETFLAALRDAAALDAARGAALSWLLGIARHKIADARRGPTHVSLAGNEPAAPVDDELLVAERRVVVTTVLEALSNDERLALEWKYIDGVSVRDIAARLGRTEKAAETLLFRARAAFKEHHARLQERGA